MNRLAALIRAGLKANFGLAVLRHRVFKEKKDLWLILLAVLGLMGLGPVLYFYVTLIKTLYGWLSPLGQQHALLTFGFLFGQLLVLFFGIYYVISAFYFSRDLEFLIPMPVRPFQVMLSKFAVILANEYLTMMPIVLPVLLTFGILAKAGPPYWISAVLIYLLLPVIPLAIVAVLVLILMRTVNFGRKKDALILVGSLVLMAAALGFQYWFNASGTADREMQFDPEAMTRFFSSSDSLLSRVGSRFPPSIWATKALAGGFARTGWQNLLLFAGTSIIILLGLAAAAEGLFYRGLIGLGETSSRAKAISKVGMSRLIHSGRRPVRAIFQREWRIMNRTPIFLLNGMLAAVIIPVIFIIMTRTGQRGMDAMLVNLIASGNPFVTTLVSACFMVICGALNGTASSTVSREGSQFWISKVIPVSPRQQVTAKFLHSYFINFLGITIASVVLVWSFRLNPGVYFMALALALLAGFTMTALGIVIDLARPLLDWTHPQKAIKQNLNVLLAMFADIALIVALWLLCKVLIRLGLSQNVILLFLFLLLAGFCPASWSFLGRFADKRYQEIEA